MIITPQMWQTWVALQEIQKREFEGTPVLTNFKTYLKWQIEAKVNNLPKINSDDQIEVAGLFISYDNRELVALLEKRASLLYQAKIG